jgi:hypothetical protein
MLYVIFNNNPERQVIKFWVDDDPTPKYLGTSKFLDLMITETGTWAIRPALKEVFDEYGTYYFFDINTKQLKQLYVSTVNDLNLIGDEIMKSKQEVFTSRKLEGKGTLIDRLANADINIDETEQKPPTITLL